MLFFVFRWRFFLRRDRRRYHHFDCLRWRMASSSRSDILGSSSELVGEVVWPPGYFGASCFFCLVVLALVSISWRTAAADRRVFRADFPGASFCVFFARLLNLFFPYSSACSASDSMPSRLLLCHRFPLLAYFMGRFHIGGLVCIRSRQIFFPITQ